MTEHDALIRDLEAAKEDSDLRALSDQVLLAVKGQGWFAFQAYQARAGRHAKPLIHPIASLDDCVALAGDRWTDWWQMISAARVYVSNLEKEEEPTLHDFRIGCCIWLVRHAAQQEARDE